MLQVVAEGGEEESELVDVRHGAEEPAEEHKAVGRLLMIMIVLTQNREWRRIRIGRHERTRLGRDGVQMGKGSHACATSQAWTQLW